MQNVLSTPPAAPEMAYPAPVSLRELLPWLLLGTALLMLIYFVAADQGAASVLPGKWLHEFAHDGRHLLGFPCH